MTNSKMVKSSRFSTLVLMACTLVSRLFGFVRLAIISSLMGTSSQADILNAVFSIPNNLRKLLAEGALSSAFIPQLNHSLEDKDPTQSRLLASNLQGIQILILIPLLSLSTFFPIWSLKPFYQFDTLEQTLLGARLFQFMAPYILFVSLSAIFKAVLESYKRFLVTGLAPLLFSISVITSLLCFYSTLGVYSMVVGVLLGGFLQWLAQAIAYAQLGYALWPRFQFKQEYFRQTLRLWFPVLLSSSIFTINQQVAIALTSTIGQVGAVSALSYAIVFWQLPFGVFSSSINTVYFPKMSRYASQNKQESFQKTLNEGLVALWVFMVPAAFLLIIWAQPLIAVAFQRNQFNLDSTLMTASVLKAYCWGMPSVALYNFLQRAFYSLKDGRTPFFCSLVLVTVDILLSLFLIKTPLKVVGIAWANTISFTLASVVLFVLYRLRYRSVVCFSFKDIFLSLVLLIPVYAYCWGVKFFLNHVIGEGWWEQGSSWLNFLIIIIIGISSLSLVYILYRCCRIHFFQRSVNK